MNIALMGLRCAGKTTVGRLVSARLGRTFIDLDERVLATFHQNSITAIWEEYGEAAWREAEVHCLRHALKRHGQVIALGGGVPMLEAAREMIDAGRRNGALRVVYLACEVDELERRRMALPRDDRPALADESLREEIERTQRERCDTYEAMADGTVDVTSQSPEATADQIAKWFEGNER